LADCLPALAGGLDRDRTGVNQAKIGSIGLLNLDQPPAAKQRCNLFRLVMIDLAAESGKVKRSHATTQWVTVICRSAARYPIGPAYSTTAWKLNPDWLVPQVFFTPICTMMGLATADRLRAADWRFTFRHLAALMFSPFLLASGGLMGDNKKSTGRKPAREDLVAP
jgi:hypothetical protein